ncbi:hypothetical protein Pelo_2823 [Pelomyxa schiedti]|nr:hypothetical protein Pelo_2823 [Pelomyxa schiedti]
MGDDIDAAPDEVRRLSERREQLRAQVGQLKAAFPGRGGIDQGCEDWDEQTWKKWQEIEAAEAQYKKVSKELRTAMKSQPQPTIHSPKRDNKVEPPNSRITHRLDSQVTFVPPKDGPLLECLSQAEASLNNVLDTCPVTIDRPSAVSVPVIPLPSTTVTAEVSSSSTLQVLTTQISPNTLKVTAPHPSSQDSASTIPALTSQVANDVMPADPHLPDRGVMPPVFPSLHIPCDPSSDSEEVEIVGEFSDSENTLQEIEGSTKTTSIETGVINDFHKVEGSDSENGDEDENEDEDNEAPSEDTESEEFGTGEEYSKSEDSSSNTDDSDLTQDSDSESEERVGEIPINSAGEEQDNNFLPWSAAANEQEREEVFHSILNADFTKMPRRTPKNEGARTIPTKPTKTHDHGPHKDRHTETNSRSTKSSSRSSRHTPERNQARAKGEAPKSSSRGGATHPRGKKGVGSRHGPADDKELDSIAKQLTKLTLDVNPQPIAFMVPSKKRQQQVQKLAQSFGCECSFQSAGRHRFAMIERTSYSAVPHHAILNKVTHNTETPRPHRGREPRETRNMHTRTSKPRLEPRHSRAKPTDTATVFHGEEVGAGVPPVGEENKGLQLLRKLGWTGGGLGSAEQGTMEPLRCIVHKGKGGIGL